VKYPHDAKFPTSSSASWLHGLPIESVSAHLDVSLHFFPQFLHPILALHHDVVGLPRDAGHGERQGHGVWLWSRWCCTRKGIKVRNGVHDIKKCQKNHGNLPQRYVYTVYLIILNYIDDFSEPQAWWIAWNSCSTARPSHCLKNSEDMRITRHWQVHK